MSREGEGREGEWRERCSLYDPCSLVTSDPEVLVRTCCEHWPAVQPWEVAMLCSTDQSHYKPVSHDDPDQSQE